MDSVQVTGSITSPFSQGAALLTIDADFWVEAWQGLGGQPALSLAALRYLETQLEELRQNPDLQPVYVQLFASGQPSPVYASRSDPNDGWYFISALEIDRESLNLRGAVQVTATFSRAATPAPSVVRMLFAGTALATTYATPPVNAISLPLNASGPAFAALRTGAEGTIQLSTPGAAGPNPLPLVLSGAITDLWKGGVRCYDTVTPGANAVVVGSLAHPNWVQVYGTDHDLMGDLILTNGLLLLRCNQGAGTDLWLWNTQGTPGWQMIGNTQYVDSGSNVGTVRGIDIDRVGLRMARVSTTLASSVGQFARISYELHAGAYDARVELQPLTEANTVSTGFQLSLTTAVKVVANEIQAVDVATQGATSLTPSAGAGWSMGIGATANQPVVGILWQNPPNLAQPRAAGVTTLGFGETTGPGQGSFRTYALWAAPYVTSPNLMAEAESGSLGTGWSSIADGAASGGNTARCLSGTLSTNADLWGVAFVPTAGVYDLWIRLRLTSLASSTVQMQFGLWNSTDSVFVPSGSVTWAPNNGNLAGGTSYIWVKVAAGVTPTATKSMRVRAVTTATLTTDWFFDQSALIPSRSSVLGQGNFPADIWAQMMGRRRQQLVTGS